MRKRDEETKRKRIILRANSEENKRSSFSLSQMKINEKMKQQEITYKGRIKYSRF